MLETVRRLGTATSGLHRSMKDTADAVGAFLVDVFHYLALFAIGATTVWSAAAAFIGMTARGRASLADILLLFIYLEIGAMVFQDHAPSGAVPDLYCNYGARARADRNCRRRAPDRHGHPGYNGRNSPSIIRRSGPKIRVIQISFRTAGI